MISILETYCRAGITQQETCFWGCGNGLIKIVLELDCSGHLTIVQIVSGGGGGGSAQILGEVDQAGGIIRSSCMMSSAQWGNKL